MTETYDNLQIFSFVYYNVIGNTHNALINVAAFSDEEAWVKVQADSRVAPEAHIVLVTKLNIKEVVEKALGKPLTRVFSPDPLPYGKKFFEGVALVTAEEKKPKPKIDAKELNKTQNIRFLKVIKDKVGDVKISTAIKTLNK